MKRTYLKASLAGEVIVPKRGSVDYVQRDTLNPGFYARRYALGSQKPPVGRAWLRHYDTRYYEVSAEELDKNTELRDHSILTHGSGWDTLSTQPGADRIHPRRTAAIALRHSGDRPV